MQKRNSLLFLLSALVLAPIAFLLSFHNLWRVIEFIGGVACFLSTICISIGFWKSRRTSQEKWGLGVASGFPLLFAVPLLLDIGDTPPTPLPHTIELVFAIIMGVLGSGGLYIGVMLLTIATRFLLASFRPTDEQDALPSMLFAKVLSYTCGEALLFPFIRKELIRAPW